MTIEGFDQLIEPATFKAITLCVEKSKSDNTSIKTVYDEAICSLDKAIAIEINRGSGLHTFLDICRQQFVDGMKRFLQDEN